MRNCKLLVTITSFSPFSIDQLCKNLLATIPSCILYQVSMGVCWVSELFLELTDQSFCHWILFSMFTGHREFDEC